MQKSTSLVGRRYVPSRTWLALFWLLVSVGSPLGLRGQSRSALPETSATQSTDAKQAADDEQASEQGGDTRAAQIQAARDQKAAGMPQVKPAKSGGVFSLFENKIAGSLGDASAGSSKPSI